MPKLYQINILSVVEANSKGVYLDGGDYGSLQLLEAPENLQKGDKINVYLYHSTPQKVVAIPSASQIQVGQCAYLEVVSEGEYGAFLNWGLPKDLLLPFSEQTDSVHVGDSYVVYVYLDRSGRAVATTKLHRHLDENQGNLQVGDTVDLMIAVDSEIGFKAVINNQQLGLIYHDELSVPLTIGAQMKGWVKNIREDGKIDLNINVLDRQMRDQLETHILKHLQQQGGRMELTDKSPPEAINQVFKVSKKNFKSALGSLYKQRLITISPGYVELV